MQTRIIHCDKCDKNISKIGDGITIQIYGLRINNMMGESIDLCNPCAKKVVDVIETKEKPIKNK